MQDSLYIDRSTIYSYMESTIMLTARRDIHDDELAKV